MSHRFPKARHRLRAALRHTAMPLAAVFSATPASVDIITREQIEERGDASVNDAITRAAGISALPHPGNGPSALLARGFTDSTSVMRLYDGTRLYGGVGVTFPFDTWPIELSHDQKQTGFTADATFEGRLAGRDNTFSVGLDVNHSSFRHINNTYVGSSGPVDLYDPDPGNFQSDFPFTPRNRNEADQYALFMENRIALTSRWAPPTRSTRAIW